jgi:hypothetical protein
MTTREAPAATAARPDDPPVQHGRPSWWIGLAALAALVLVAIASTLAMAPTGPVPADAPADVFSAGRALRHIEAIADSARPVGSAQHAEARAYLLQQLASLGWRTEVQESVGKFDFGNVGTQNMAAVANVIATKPGSQATGTVLLTATATPSRDHRVPPTTASALVCCWRPRGRSTRQSPFGTTS